MQAGVFIREKNQPKLTSSFVRPAKVHHQQAGLPVLNYKRHKLTKNIDITMKIVTESTLQRCREDFRHDIIPNVDRELMRDDVRHFDDKFVAYSKPELLKLKFQKHLRTAKATDKFVSKVIGRKKNHLVLYGNGWGGIGAFRG